MTRSPYNLYTWGGLVAESMRGCRVESSLVGGEEVSCLAPRAGVVLLWGGGGGDKWWEINVVAKSDCEVMRILCTNTSRDIYIRKPGNTRMNISSKDSMSPLHV